jgi:putative addiction module CopG family antidote
VIMRYYGDRQMTRFVKSASVWSMTTMNVSLPDELKIFVDERVSHDGYGSTSEYVRDLIRRDRESSFENWQRSISNQPAATTPPKPTSQQPSAS